LLGVGEAFGVNAEEDGDAVVGPFGDLGGGDAGVEPGGQACVPQVVRALSERRGLFGLWGSRTRPRPLTCSFTQLARIR
jgi:hypothetical protein